MNIVDNGYIRNEKKLSNNKITAEYIRNLRLDNSKRYKILVINKNVNNAGPNPFEPTRVVLKGRIVSQYNSTFLFECLNSQNILKKVCINKIDYILNNKLITAIN